MKRKQYITHKSYQRGVIFGVILICAIGLLINLSVFNFFSHREIESLRWRMHIPVNTIGDIISQYLIYSAILSVAFVVIALLIYFRHLIKNTDRILYSLKNDIEKVAEGDLSFSVSLNERDDFKDISDSCNRMICSLKQKFLALKVKMYDLNEILEDIEQAKDKKALIQKTQLLIDTLEYIKKEI